MLIAALPSTKNCNKQPNPEMHHLKRVYDLHFGMTAYIGAEVAFGLLHTLIGVAGNVADVRQLHALRRCAEMIEPADASY